MTFDEYIDDQRSRLAQMATDDGDTWDLSDNDRAACQSGADAIAIIAEFMHTPWFHNDPRTVEMHEATFAKMRELLCRGQKP